MNTKDFDFKNTTSSQVNWNDIYTKYDRLPKETLSLPSNTFLNTLTSERQASAEVKEIIDYTLDFITTKQADTLLASYDNDWYKQQGFSKRLVAYLKSIKINKLIWRLRKLSSLYGESFLIPFFVPKYNKLYWYVANISENVWYQRLIDDYLNMVLYFSPIKGSWETVYAIGIKPNMITWLDLKFQNADSNKNNPTNNITSGNGFNTTALAFDFYRGYVFDKPVPTNTGLPMCNWPNNPDYKPTAYYFQEELRLYGETTYILLEDIQLSDMRVIHYRKEISTDRQQNLKEKWLYRNERQRFLDSHIDIINPAQFGDSALTNPASGAEVNYFLRLRLWKEIIEKAGLFTSPSTKGGTNQHTPEIVLEQKEALIANQKKVKELKQVLMDFINLTIKINNFQDKTLVSKNFRFSYKFPLTQVLQAITVATTPKVPTMKGNNTNVTQTTKSQNNQTSN